MRGVRIESIELKLFQIVLYIFFFNSIITAIENQIKLLKKLIRLEKGQSG
jgi:hypothetical protein